MNPSTDVESPFATARRIIKGKDYLQAAMEVCRLFDKLPASDWPDEAKKALERKEVYEDFIETLSKLEDPTGQSGIRRVKESPSSSEAAVRLFALAKGSGRTMLTLDYSRGDGSGSNGSSPSAERQLRSRRSFSARPDGKVSQRLSPIQLHASRNTEHHQHGVQNVLDLGRPHIGSQFVSLSHSSTAAAAVNNGKGDPAGTDNHVNLLRPRNPRPYASGRTANDGGPMLVGLEAANRDGGPDDGSSWQQKPRAARRDESPLRPLRPLDLGDSLSRGASPGVQSATYENPYATRRNDQGNISSDGRPLFGTHPQQSARSGSASSDSGLDEVIRRRIRRIAELRELQRRWGQHDWQ